MFIILATVGNVTELFSLWLLLRENIIKCEALLVSFQALSRDVGIAGGLPIH
jgi:hypothetical protein